MTAFLNGVRAVSVAIAFAAGLPWVASPAPADETTVVAFEPCDGWGDDPRCNEPEPIEP